MRYRLAWWAGVSWLVRWLVGWVVRWLVGWVGGWSVGWVGGWVGGQLVALWLRVALDPAL